MSSTVDGLYIFGIKINKYFGGRFRSKIQLKTNKYKIIKPC